MARYVYEVEELTCVSLEKELGLKRGDINELTIYPEGAVEIETAIELNTTQQDELKAALAKRNLPRGKRPEQSRHYR